jgi:hypothetical protein
VSADNIPPSRRPVLVPDAEIADRSFPARSTETSINGWIPPIAKDLLRFDFAASEERRLTHQLFRFPAKFHAPIVRQLIENYTSPGDRVLDIFCGSGTLLVEASVAGRHATGFDVDPLSVFLSRTKSRRVDIGALRATAALLLHRLEPLERPGKAYTLMMHDDLDTVTYEAELTDLPVPAIPNLAHWFRRYVVVDLARILRAINDLRAEAAVRDVLRVVFAATIRAASNADPVPVSGLERTRHMLARDEAGRLVNPFNLFRRRLHRALDDVESYQVARDSMSICRAQRADATAALPLRAGESVQAACSSPPYHGAVDYYRRHQLEMFWLGLTTTQHQRLQLLDQYLGRPHVPQSHRFVAKANLSQWPEIAECEQQIRGEAPRRADEFRHYCVGMGRAFARLAAVLPAGAPAIFVVGHSRWNQASLDTSVLFTELAGADFRLDERYWYPVKNRHMSYGRRNGANIDREFVLVFRRT